MKVDHNEWLEIANRLECHHAIFYKLWSIGKPVLNNSIDTAAVSFDKLGNFILFQFNENFWSNLDIDGKLFVICHEMLHIILNHGKRSKNTLSENKIAANMALDIVVNHSLINSFGFDKKNISKSLNTAFNEMGIDGTKESDCLCWVDNIFPDKKLDDDQYFEFYFNQFKKQYGDGLPNMALKANNGCLDDHSKIEQNEWTEVFKKLSSDLSNEETESIKDFVNKNFLSENQSKIYQMFDKGSSKSDNWVFWKDTKIKKRKKWESVIKNWEMKLLNEVYSDHEQWARIARRYQAISSDFFIPSEIEMYHHGLEEKKIEVFFFLDTSGSCWNLKNRFFNAASSLCKRNFKIRLFCFDTVVKETTLESKKIYGGGGTSFNILEEFVFNQINEKKINHPTIFVLTDGFGDNIFTKNPNKWHWFLTENGTINWIDKNCKKIYNLKDYD